jgi:GxxExxY protein
MAPQRRPIRVIRVNGRGGKGLTSISSTGSNSGMGGMFYRAEVFQLIGFCMEIHRELGKGHDEVIYKDDLVIELSRAQIPYSREKNYEVIYQGVLLPHRYYADFVVWDKILFEAKAVQALTDSHTKQVLNYLAASKLRLGLLANFGAGSLEWRRIIL